MLTVSKAGRHHQPLAEQESFEKVLLSFLSPASEDDAVKIRCARFRRRGLGKDKNNILAKEGVIILITNKRPRYIQ